MVQVDPADHVTELAERDEDCGGEPEVPAQAKEVRILGEQHLLRRRHDGDFIGVDLPRYAVEPPPVEWRHEGEEYGERDEIGTARWVGAGCPATIDE